MIREILICSAVLLTALFVSGCNEYERRGLSPLPQNRPAAWETHPLGGAGFRN